jgi:hypothetical protein
MPLLDRPKHQPPRWVGDDRAHIPWWSLRALLLPVALAVVLAGRSDLASWWAIARLKWRYRHAPRSRTPGLVFVQIDGLSEPVLRRALDTGVMPTLACWLRGGTHCLTSWEAGLPSETSASQAGILHGTNWDIPSGHRPRHICDAWTRSRTRGTWSSTACIDRRAVRSPRSRSWSALTEDWAGGKTIPSCSIRATVRRRARR